MDPPHLCGEPFKATQLWNMIIRDFRAGMPLKRHRKGLRGRHHDNCFTSTEAIDWLHDYLQNCDRFGPWVTRAQAVSLLEKFLYSKVIQGVKGSMKSSPVKFEDNADLYKFVPVSPMKKLRSALTSRSNLRSARTPLKTLNSEPVGRTLSYDNAAFNVQHADQDPPGHGDGGGRGRALPQCRLVQRPLTPAQREEVWKSTTLNRLQRLLWLTSLDGIVDAGSVSAKHIIHSCTHVSRNGVVLVPRDQDDLPHWVLSAMKCLANWPYGPDSGLPSYPGFERDVFKTISSYFQGLPQPLLPFDLHDLIVESFITAERRDRGLYPGDESLTTPPQTIQGLTSFQSVENLMLNMTSAGMFGFSPELAGAPERRVGVGGSISGTRGFPRDASSKRLKLMDGRKWIGEIPPSSAASRIEAGSGRSSSERSGNALRRSRSPSSRRGKRGIQRSSSMSVPGLARPDSAGNRQPIAGDGKHLSTQPQGMRRCISEPTTGCQGHKCSRPVRVPRESPPTTSSNRMESGWLPHPDPPRETDRPRQQLQQRQQQQPNQRLRHRPLSAPVQQATPTFPSATDLHVPGQHQPEIPGLGGKSRKFTSQIIVTEQVKGSSFSTHGPATGVVSGQARPSTESSSSSKALDYGFPSQRPDPASNTRRGFGSLSDIGNAVESNPTKETNTRNLFASKRFGSASELIQKIFKKKTASRDADAPSQPVSLGRQLRGSVPNLVHQQTQQPSSSAPNPDKATPANPTAVNNVRVRQQERISPSYPPPLRATLSYSDIGSSRENSANHTPDSYPQINRQRNGSSHDLRSMARGQSSAGCPKMKRSDSTASLYLSDDKSYTEEALRLCCLLLPPVNRRKLHLLLKLMTKMEANPDLVLSNRKTTRQLVLETFSRAILRCQEEIDYNETLASRIVEYLMDNHGNVFSQPQELKADIQDRLVYLGRSQIKYTTETENQTSTAPSYCQKVSVEEYEAQKLSNSERAVADLLEVIIRDQKIPAKDKKKKLKQFQKTYPDIYARRLPATATEAELFPEKPKIKQPMTNVRKSFSKLKALR